MRESQVKETIRERYVDIDYERERQTETMREKGRWGL